ncbi:MAG: pitrilysin family protein [Balneolaceae bacterium]
MKRSILLMLMLLISVSAIGQKKYDEIEYPEINEFEKTEVEEFTLDNGITFYLVEDKELPLIRINARVRTGSLLEPLDKTGLASLTGTVMREGGSENYPSDELNLLLENNAAFMSTSIGLGSGSASLNLLKENFDDLLPVFVDLIQNPAFPEDKIDLAKTQAKSNIARRNDNQQSIAVREFQKLIYGEDTPYTSQTEYATIDAITREDLVEFHKQAFVGNNMMIGVIGDFDTSEMKKKLEEAFGSLNAGSETNLIYPEVNYDYPTTVNIIDKPEVNQSFVLTGHVGGLRDNPDYAALQLMNEILSGGFSGRLMQTVRSDLGLAYAVFGSYTSNIHYPGWFYVGVMTKSSTTAEAIDAMLAEVKKLQESPVSEEELNSAKDRFLNSLIFRYDSKNKILNERLNNEYNGLPQDYFDQYVEELKQVTAEDIQRVANEYIKPDDTQILVVGNKEEIGDQLDKYGEVNEIDITIPEPPSDEEESAGDAAQGMEWLNKMADAIIESGTEVSTILEEAVITQKTPMGDMEMESSASTNYVDYSFNRTMQTPQGEMTINFQNGSGTLNMMGQQQQLPPQMAGPMLNEMKRHYMSIVLNKNKVEAEYLGEETIDDETYAVLRIKDDITITYYLDPETGLPARSRYSEMNPQTGQRQQAESVYTDWTSVDGVTYAYTTTTFADGEVAAVVTVTSHNVE